MTTRKPTRSNELASGFDHYHRIAYKIALRFHYASTFHDPDDLSQATALAALEALNTLGQTTTLKQLTPLLQRSLYQQAVAYGFRSRTITTHDQSGHKTKTSHRLQREITFAHFTLPSGHNLLELSPTTTERATAVSEFTLKAAQHLHLVVNLPDPTETEDPPHKAEMRQRLQKIMNDDPRLKTFLTWHLERNPNQSASYATVEAEGICSNKAAFRLLQKARLLAGADYDDHTLQMARKVAEAYRLATDKRLHRLALQLGISTTTLKKYLLIARTRGLLLEASAD